MTGGIPGQRRPALQEGKDEESMLGTNKMARGWNSTGVSAHLVQLMAMQTE